jgi:hypothetical protein
MKKFNSLYNSILVLLLVMVSCKGTDVLDDPIVKPTFVVTQTQIALRIGQTADLNAMYFNEYGIEKPVNFTWVSSQNQIVNLTNSGKVTGVSAGSTQVYPQYQTTIGNAINVTVVPNDNAVAKVTISSSKTTLALNENINLSVLAQNINNQTVTGDNEEWFSENSAILTVNSSGQVKAIANGVAGIHAKVNGVKSNSIDFTVGSSQLMGTFTAAGGYKAVGTATLKSQNGQITLELSSNFETSFALGTFIYLANSTNGSNVRSSGLEIAEIKSNGAKTFNVSQIKCNVSLQEYKYVIILCKPASLTFGFAELK